MNLLLLVLMLLAGAGLVTSFLAHLAALFVGLPLVLEPFRENIMSTLTMGVFVVWFPAVLIARRATRSERMNLSWRQVLAGCPPWMRGAAYGLLAYALLNFVLQLAGGSPAGGFSEARLASGHWMLFYGAAFCIFYSVMHKPDLQEPSQCPAGHEVGRDDAFCAQCGLPLNTGRQR